MSKNEDIEERAVSADEVRGGVKLAAGHAVVLIVDGAQGTPRQRGGAASADDGSTTPESGATGGETAPAPAASGRAASRAPAAAATPWASGAQAMRPPPAGPPPPKPPYADAAGKLSDCRFQDGKELEDDTAWLAAKCGGLDGQQVQFVLESDEGGEWRPVASGVSTVKAGEARTGIAIPSK